MCSIYSLCVAKIYFYKINAMRSRIWELIQDYPAGQASDDWNTEIETAWSWLVIIKAGWYCHGTSFCYFLCFYVWDFPLEDVKIYQLLIILKDI